MSTEWGGGGSGTNFQLLILSLNLPKTKFPYVHYGGVGGGGVHDQLWTFDPESKSAKNWNSLCQQEGEGRGGVPDYVRRGWGGVPDYVRHLVRIWGELQNFDKKIFHSLRVSASQVSYMQRLIM